jgi:2-methylcitrate dehydratase
LVFLSILRWTTRARRRRFTPTRLTGPAPICEGRKGFFQLVATPADADVAAFSGRNVRFRIHDCGVKTYPAVVYS